MTRRSPSTTKELKSIIANAAIAHSVHGNDISIKELAEASGLAIGSIYRVIKTKSDLKKIIDDHCEALFNAQVFAAIPAKLSLRDRFSLVLTRIFQFAQTNNQAANYLAHNGFGQSSLMVMSCVGFAAEGQKSGIINQKIIEYVYPIIWGPISAVIKGGQSPISNTEVIDDSIWAALTIG